MLIQDKFDEEKALALIELGFPENQKYLGHMLEWMQDANWPVAMVLQPYLASLGEPIVSHIKLVLEGEDPVWKYWCIRCLIDEMPVEAAKLLCPHLEKLAAHPSDSDRLEEVDLVAAECLARLRLS